eukprot:scaffold3012_cov396-Prasinococcus_capsulatus_cf.AAC.3
MCTQRGFPCCSARRRLVDGQSESVSFTATLPLQCCADRVPYRGSLGEAYVLASFVLILLVQETVAIFVRCGLDLVVRWIQSIDRSFQGARSSCEKASARAILVASLVLHKEIVKGEWRSSRLASRSSGLISGTFVAF